MSSPRVVRRRVVAGLLSLFLAFPTAFLTFSPQAHAATRPFALRYSADVPGDIAFVANTILTCTASVACGRIQTGVNAGTNNGQSMVHIDDDTDSTTFNSSSSTLALPAGSTVLFAGLYWGAVSTASAAANVKFKAPAAATYTTIASTTFDTINSSYSAFADVTATVAAAGNGAYWAADIHATQSGGTHGGWGLVVHYSSPGSKTRNCSVFDGLEAVNSTIPKTITVAGFRTPPTGTVSSRLGVIAYEGDRGTTGDALSINGSVISDTVNPANDFFNSSISMGGAHVTTKSPNYQNTLGFDADILEVSNPGNAVLANNATSATIGLATVGDVYFPAVVTLCTELYAPQIVTAKTATDTSPETPLLAGDQIRYTLDVRNTGQDGATGSVLEDVIPSWTTYVPGSLSIDSGPGAGTVSDILGDDRGEFTGTAVRIRVGSNATALVGGTIPPDHAATGSGFTSISFLVHVNAGAPDGLVVSNTATIDYRGQTLLGSGTASSNTAAMTVSNVADLKVAISNSRTTGIAGNPVSYVVTFSNRSATVGVTNAVIANAIPSAVENPTWTCSGASCPSASGIGGPSGNLSLPALATVTYTVTGTVNAAYSGSITNPVSITSPPGTTDPDQSNNAASDVDTITTSGDLSITKSNGVVGVEPGSVVTWTIAASNSGPSTAVAATVTDTLPAAVLSALWTCSASAGSSCALTGTGSINTPVTLLSGGTATFTVVATLQPSASGSLINAASISAPAGFVDAVSTNNTSTDTDSIGSLSDLAVTKSHLPAVIVPGLPVDWTISVNNLGPSVTPIATISDSLPAGFEVTSVSSSSWSCTNTTTSVSCSATDLAVGTSTIVVRTTSDPAISGSITNSAVLTSVTDPISLNNTGSVTSVLVPNGDVRISKSHAPTVLPAGTTATWTVDVTNVGPSSARNVVMTDPFAPGVTVTNVTSSDPGWSCSTDVSQVVTCSNALVGPGQSTTFEITGDISPGLPAGSLTNTASVTTSTIQDTTNDLATDVATVVAEADLATTKSRIGTLVSGSAITYRVVAVNNGPADVEGATVIDIIPSELAGATWSCTGPRPGACPESGLGNLSAPISLKHHEQAVFTISATALAGATGTVQNVATISNPAGVIDPNPLNNDAIDTSNAVTRTALSISKTNNSLDVTPGTVSRYEITVRNDGPSTATGATIVDTLSSSFLSATWTCVAVSGSCPTSGTGGINSSITLAPSGTATFVVLASVSPLISGSVTNTATVVAPIGAVDPDLSDNVAADVDTLTPQADISITNTDSLTTAVPGTTVAYTIVVSNAGPSSASGVRMVDTLPTDLTDVTWTCTASSASACASSSGSGATIDEFVNLAPSGTVTFIATGTVASNARATMTTTATATLPAGVLDLTPLDLVSTDTTALSPIADITVLKTGLPLTAVPGRTIIYTLIVSNTGPSSASGVDVADPLPMGIASATWTCNATAGSVCAQPSGTDAIVSSVDLASGGSAEFTITATIDPAATGTVTNVATATLPTGVSDPTPSSNEAVVVTALTPIVDVSVVATSPSSTGGVRAGDELGVTIVVRNNGPSAANGTTVSDALASVLLNPTWTCVATPGSSCPASGVGNVATSVDLAPLGSVTFTIVGTVDPASSINTITNSATAQVTLAITDSNPGNNSSSVVVAVTRFGDLSIVKTSTSLRAVPGSAFEWMIVVANTGPSTMSGSRVVDTIPSIVTGASWSCGATPGSRCSSGGAQGNIDTTVDLLAGGTAVFTVIGNIDPWAGSAATTSLQNTATVTRPTDAVDPDPTNNTDTHSVALEPTADIELTKSNAQTQTIPGTTSTYSIGVLNHGPSAVRALTITDLLPPPFDQANAAWVCTTSLGLTGGCDTVDGSGAVAANVDLEPNESATITVSVPILSSASGLLANTATATLASFATDPAPANNVAVDTDLLVPTADLSITKTDSTTSAIPGNASTYTIVVNNAGPSDAIDTNVTDLLPAGLSLASWTCTASAMSSCAAAGGTGSIATTADLKAGGRATFLMTATVLSSARGTLANIATVTPSGTVTDPSLSNNSATDINTLIPTADVSITKTNNASTHVPGQPSVYTIVAANSGPSDAPSTHIVDNLPSGLSNPRWTCTTTGAAVCPDASGSTDLDSYVDLPSGTSVTYTLTVDSESTVTGVQTNAAQALVSNGIVDPDPGNNTATDSDLVTPAANLVVTKSHAPNVLVSGNDVDYTITVHNEGPSAAPGVSINDPLASVLENATWTCTGSASATCSAASGVGSPSLQANLPLDGTVTISVHARISEFASGTLSNTVEARLPATVLDPSPDTSQGAVLGTTTATDSTSLDRRVDVSIAKSDSLTNATPGTAHTYEILVRNIGPSAVSGVVVRDELPAKLHNPTWTCAPSVGARCLSASGPGDIATEVDLGSNTSARFVVSSTISETATGTLQNTATLTVPQGVDDHSSADNTSTDIDTLVPEADLVVTKTRSRVEVVPGRPITYVITVENKGPSAAPSVLISDQVPSALTNVGWTCSGSSGASCSDTDGSGSITTSAEMPAGSAVSFTAVATVTPSHTGVLENSATATSGSGVLDPTPGDASSTDSTVVVPRAALSIEKTHTEANVVPGQSVRYRIVARNEGPSDAPGVRVEDTLPPALLGATWSCVGTNGASCASGGGTGSIASTVDLPANSHATFVVDADVEPSRKGILDNTATLFSPAGVIDTTSGDDSATDSAHLVVTADLSVVKTHAPSVLVPGRLVAYSIVVTNNGPSNVNGAQTIDRLPQGIGNAVWSCAASIGAVCAQGSSGTGDLDAFANLASGASVTYSSTAMVSSSATGPITNAATVFAPTGVTDPDPSNNSADDNPGLNPVGDLTIRKSLTSGPPVPGRDVTYEIEVTNAGPSDIPGVRVVDTLPASLSRATWSCAGVGGANCAQSSGAGDLDLSVNIPAGDSAQITVRAHIDESAVGLLSNRATATLPSGITNASPTDDSTIMTEPLVPTVDVRVAKSHSPVLLIPGDDITYRVTVANQGPSTAASVDVIDEMPSVLSSTTWTCSASEGSSCLGSSTGVGDIRTEATIAAGGAVTYDIRARITSEAIGSVINSASVALPQALTDLSVEDDSVTDIGALAPHADVRVTKSDFATEAIPGTRVTYTITATNHGPSRAAGTRIVDQMPPELTDVTWTCTADSEGSCSDATGTGSIDVATNLRPGSTATFFVSATIQESSTGSLVNSVVASTAAGVFDPNTEDNEATDANQLTPTLDLGIEKSDGAFSIAPGRPVVYTITATNHGPSSDPGVSIVDTPPEAMRNPMWTCNGCTVTSGRGPIDTTAALRSGQSVTVTYSGTIDTNARGMLTNTAKVRPSAGVMDRNRGNDESTDQDVLGPASDIEIKKSHEGPVVAGEPITYTISVVNHGPSAANDVRVLDAIPEGLLDASWSCRGPRSVSCAQLDGTGAVDTLSNIAVGETITITLTANVSSSFTGTLTNRAQVYLSDANVDPTPNNEGVDSAESNTVTNLRLRKRVVTKEVLEGMPVTYEVVVENRGPSLARGAKVRDLMPAGVKSAVWTCTASMSATCEKSSGEVPTNGYLSAVDLPNATSATFLITGIAGSTPRVTNVAEVFGGPGSTDPDLSDNQDQVTSDVQTVIEGFGRVTPDPTTTTSTTTSATATTTPRTVDPAAGPSPSPSSTTPRSGAAFQPEPVAVRAATSNRDESGVSPAGEEEADATRPAPGKRTRSARVAANGIEADQPLELAFTGFRLANFFMAIIAIAVGSCLVGIADPRMRRTRRRR